MVQPKLETVPGVAQAQILGGNTYAMRIWLNTQRMAGLGVSMTDIYNALNENNVLAAAGSTKGDYVEISIKPNTDLSTVKGFQNLIVKKGKDGSFVRLGDVAKVKLGSQTYDSSVYFNGEKAVFMGIYDTPEANPLTVFPM